MGPAFYFTTEPLAVGDRVKFNAKAVPYAGHIGTVRGFYVSGIWGNLMVVVSIDGRVGADRVSLPEYMLERLTPVSSVAIN
jgi:hypothetical protein